MDYFLQPQPTFHTCMYMSIHTQLHNDIHICIHVRYIHIIESQKHRNTYKHTQQRNVIITRSSRNNPRYMDVMQARMPTYNRIFNTDAYRVDEHPQISTYTSIHTHTDIHTYTYLQTHTYIHIHTWGRLHKPRAPKGRGHTGYIFLAVTQNMFSSIFAASRDGTATPSLYLQHN